MSSQDHRGTEGAGGEMIGEEGAETPGAPTPRTTHRGGCSSSSLV